MDIQKIGVKVLVAIFIFSLFSLVSSQPPFQTISTENSIAIESPVIEYIKANEAFEFHVHAHNSSNGLILGNDTTSCIIHIYSGNINGEHLIQADMNFDPNDIDFYYEVAGGNFTEGSYAALFYCSVQGERGGYFEYPFTVNLGGDSNVYILVTDIFLICLMVFFLLVVGRNYAGVDFEKIDNRITDSYDGSLLKTYMKTFGYGLMRAAFLWYYFFGWLLLFFIRDLMFRFGPTEMYTYLILIMDIYSIGFLLVIVFFARMIWTQFEKMREIIDDMSRGIV